MFEDIFSIIQWWSALFFLGWIIFPLTFLLFPSFPDRGYGFAKTLGIIILTYTVFLLGTLHLVPFTTTGLFFSLLLSNGIILFFISKKYSSFFKKAFLPFLKKNIWFILFEESLFLLILFLWSFVRAHAPEINGLEKFMDYGFINSVLNSQYFPAKDMWLYPFSINYYYFGHITTAVLTKLSFLPSSITYNLMVATVASLCFQGSFSIGSTLISLLKGKKRFLKNIVTGGILSGVLVTFAGNLHTLYSLFTPYENEHPVPLWNLVFSPSSFPNNYWYPNATRFIYNTIHEFPIYSWVVSDLHGHVLDIPFVLLTIAFLLSFYLSLQNQKNSLKDKHSSSVGKLLTWLQLNDWQLTGKLLIISFLLAILYMTNAWDGVIYLMLTGIILFFIRWKQLIPLKKSLSQKVLLLLRNLFPSLLIVLLGFFIFSLPFSLFFKPFVSGIGILCAPNFLTKIGSLGPFLFEQDHCQRSPLWQLLILHGFFYFFVTLFLIFLGRVKKLFASDIFVLFLILLSTFLIIITEFAYMKDIYPAHYRANTMFKLVFQSFIMLSLSTGYIIIRLSIFIKNHQKRILLYPVFLLVITPLLLAVLVYPYFAVMSYYGELKTYHGLNGTSYLEDKYPADYQALLYLQKNIKNQPVILEAQGDSYTDYGRISANTGLPTILGWTVHEWLWRGSYDVPAPRIEEVKTLYESNNIEETKKLLKKYNVSYVFIGDLEREKYPELNVEKFEKLGMVVFEKDKTKIVEMSH